MAESLQAVPGEHRYDFFAVLDFECTCERDCTCKVRFPHEIIEFPVVFLNARSLEIDLEFHRFVRPVERPVLSDFCTELTGITQALVDAADPLDVVISEFEEFLEEHSLVSRRADLGPAGSGKKRFLICTDGPWDICGFFKPEAARKKLGLRGFWDRFLDVRSTFAEAYANGRRESLADMLARQGLEFQGREHSGLDDARNIARLLALLLRDGMPLGIKEATNHRPGSSRRRK